MATRCAEPFEVLRCQYDAHIAAMFVGDMKVLCDAGDCLFDGLLADKAGATDIGVA